MAITKFLGWIFCEVYLAQVLKAESPKLGDSTSLAYGEALEADSTTVGTCLRGITWQHKKAENKPDQLALSSALQSFCHFPTLTHWGVNFKRINAWGTHRDHTQTNVTVKRL